MSTALIIGSGPAAAGVAMALTADPSQRVMVLDIGEELEAGQKAVQASIASTAERDWLSGDIEKISQQPVSSEGSVLPEKRSYGSNFPFRDKGQLSGLRAVGQANRSVVSGAYGGFSNVWGAQIMPFSAATFDRWPVSRAEMEPHYRIALDEMTLAADEDDLDALFPLIATPRPLPPLADRTLRVLERYESHRAFVQSHGITIGRARLALRSEDCTRCGLCMTGCPYGLIYSASHTFDRLRAAGRITYRKNVLAVALTEHDSVPEVHVRDLSTGLTERISADRIYVACGGIGTTRLVLGSLKHFDRPLQLEESVQFVIPAISKSPTPDPRQSREFTLNQFNLVYDASGDGLDLCQIHFYPHNPTVESALPQLFQHPRAAPLTTALLRRVSVGLGYIPSWASPKVQVTAHRGAEGSLPDLVVDREPFSGWPPMLRSMSAALMRVGAALDFWPVLPQVIVSAAAKSYHFGSSFPHSDSRGNMTTDRLGRLDRWDNIHLVDASVFPNVPATTFTLTIMANAHRIATESLLQAPA
jgi:choline dehydrogenase-like flavoprotein